MEALADRDGRLQDAMGLAAIKHGMLRKFLRGESVQAQRLTRIKADTSLKRGQFMLDLPLCCPRAVDISGGEPHSRELGYLRCEIREFIQRGRRRIAKQEVRTKFLSITQCSVLQFVEVLCR